MANVSVCCPVLDVLGAAISRAARPQPSGSQSIVTGQLVSIAIPTVDRFSYLIEAVEAALAQTWPHIEVLVGDDGDSPQIRDWCSQRSRADARLRYEKNHRRLGIARNWNAMAARACGEFIVFQGDDDRLLPQFVATLMNATTP